MAPASNPDISVYESVQNIVISYFLGIPKHATKLNIVG